MNIFLFFALVFLFTFIVGRMLEKIKIPWIFASLILGSILALYNPFGSITSSDEYNLAAMLGMYFLLFVIGFEIDLNKFRKNEGFIIKSTFFIIILEAILGGMFIHYVFGYDWWLSFIVAMSFATVGEAIVIPILEEFRIVNTRLGQTIIGIGTLDDIIEIIVLTLVIVWISSGNETPLNILLIVGSLILLFALTFWLTKLRKEGQKFTFLNVKILFLLVLFIFFLFMGIGEFSNVTSIGALFAGIGLRTFVPKKRLAFIESEVKTMCYGFFAPLFFVSVGVTMNMNYLIKFPLFVVLVVIVSNGAKIIGSYIMGKKLMGNHNAILLGIGLSARFSTSIIILKILLENNLIGQDLYSVIIASSVLSTFIVPFLFSELLVKWRIGKQVTEFRRKL